MTAWRDRCGPHRYRAMHMTENPEGDGYKDPAQGFQLGSGIAKGME